METLNPVLDPLPLAQRRALLDLQARAQWFEPMATETIAAGLAGLIPWANVEGIPSEELDAYLEGAELLLRDGRWDDAHKVLSYVASVDSTCAYAHLGLGTVALEQHDPAQAIAFFTAAAECFGGDLGAYAGRAIARMTSGDFLGACEDMARAVEHDPDGKLTLTLRMAALFKEASPEPVTR